MKRRKNGDEENGFMADNGDIYPHRNVTDHKVFVYICANVLYKVPLTVVLGVLVD